MPHPPNSFHYVRRKTFIVILMIKLSKKIFNNSITQVHITKQLITKHVSTIHHPCATIELAH